MNARGFTLIELLVGIALGWLVVSGALALHQAVNRSSLQAAALAELNDTARFALAYIETDLRQAGFLGLNGNSESIDGIAGPGDPVAIPVRADCGPNWAVELTTPVAGFNNRYGLDCAPYRGAMTGSDVLVVRRASGRLARPEAGRLQLHTSLAGGRLGADGRSPPSLTPPIETRDVIVGAYYVSRSSSLATGTPSLRRKVLQTGPRVVDEELMPGVEDLQLQLGLDLDPRGTPGHGSVDVWVNPEDPRLDDTDARVAGARIWLLVGTDDPVRTARAPLPAYADRAAPAPADRRRLLVARSYALRNAAAWP